MNYQARKIFSYNLEYEKDPAYVNQVLKTGAIKANEIAQSNMQKIHEVVGNL